MDSTAKTLADAMACKYDLLPMTLNITRYSVFFLSQFSTVQIIENMAIELYVKSFSDLDCFQEFQLIPKQKSKEFYNHLRHHLTMSSFLNVGFF